MVYDLVINNGTVVEPYRGIVTVANLGIKDGKIDVITRAPLTGKKEIDAGLQVVCPGFVDIHCHVDNYLYGGRCHALQGVTTAVGGNCGLSPTPPDEFFKVLKEQGFPINQGQLVGHSFSMRAEVGATDNYKPADEQQIAKMVELAEQRLAQGALGISFGLEYAPGSSYQEITALCRVAARYGKLVAVHTRVDSWPGLASIQETIRFSRDTGVALQISHLVYQAGMGMMTEALCLIEEAIKEGLDVTVDSGLYSAFATFIGSAVFDPGCLEKWGCDYYDIYVATGPYAHKRCDEELFLKIRKEEPDTVVTAFAGRDAEVIEAFKKPFVMVSSDAAIGSPEPGTGHPQDSGTFPKFFRLLVRETGTLTLLDAVKRCTWLPAKRLGLKQKGTLNPGADADVVIFDINKIQDHSGYPGLGQPDAPPTGISYVLVNGVPVVENGCFKEGVNPGRAVTLPNEYWRL